MTQVKSVVENPLINIKEVLNKRLEQLANQKSFEPIYMKNLR